MTTKCFCGQDLHYTDPEVQAHVQRMVDDLGAVVRVRQLATGRVFLVPRHFIALHGLKEEELDRYGFQELVS
jgi:hypothetical protein